MTITPNTAFSDGNPFTANQANRFPRGVMGLYESTSAFGTTGTHTTFQDTGATITFTEQSGRIYRIQYFTAPYPNGGLQGIKYQLVRASSALKIFEFPSGMLSTAVACAVNMGFVYTSTSSGSVTFKMQIAALTSNTSVQDYAAASLPRQFVIEDLGES